MFKRLRQNRVKIVSFILALFLLLTVLTDFHYKYLFRLNIRLPNELLYLKLLIGITFLFLSISYFKFFSYKKSYLLIGAIIVCTIINALFSETENLYRLMYIQGQYYFGIIVFFFYMNYWKQIELKYLLIALKVILWFNFMLILVGHFFDILLFKTYWTRFGVDGFFKSTSVASYFYMFSLMLFLNKKKSLETTLIIIVIIISSLLVGSKTLYAFFIFTGLFFIAKKGALLVENRKIFYTVFVGILSVLSFIFLKPLLLLNFTLKKVLLEHGIITAVFSYRDVLVKNAINQVNNEFTIINYLFGGLEYIQKLPQVSMIDLLLIFGLVGSVLFICFIIFNFPKIKNRNVLFMLVCIGVLILLRGNFFYYPSEMFISMTIFAMTLKTIEINNYIIKI